MMLQGSDSLKFLNRIQKKSLSSFPLARTLIRLGYNKELQKTRGRKKPLKIPHWQGNVLYDLILTDFCHFSFLQVKENEKDEQNPHNNQN